MDLSRHRAATGIGGLRQLLVQIFCDDFLRLRGVNAALRVFFFYDGFLSGGAVRMAFLAGHAGFSVWFFSISRFPGHPINRPLQPLRASADRSFATPRFAVALPFG